MGELVVSKSGPEGSGQTTGPQTDGPVAADIRSFLERLSGGDMTAAVPGDDSFGPALARLRDWLRRKTPAPVPPAVQVVQDVRKAQCDWKAGLAAMFTGRRLPGPETMACGQGCALGRWIATERAADLLEAGSLAALTSAHERSHSAAMAAVTAFGDGNIMQAYARMAEVEHACDAITAILDAVIRAGDGPHRTTSARPAA